MTCCKNNEGYKLKEKIQANKTIRVNHITITISFTVQIYVNTDNKLSNTTHKIQSSSINLMIKKLQAFRKSKSLDIKNETLHKKNIPILIYKL